VLISLAWLRELLVGADRLAAEDVARALSARGLTVDAVGSSGADTVLDIDVPANRPDALGHRGVAREVAAALGLALAPPPDARATSGAPADGAVRVVIDAPELCGRYTAGIVRGVRVGPSPAWVVERLAACGLRSIDNVVDASNLVMLELGQPVHFFDLARLAGPEIHVRGARDGERLTTLDGVERTLAPGMVVIADARRAVALGGVMGGAATEIGHETRDVLVEAAWFAPAAVRGAARALGLSTDASQRFERGGDIEAPSAAQVSAARRLAELAGGTPAPGLVDVRVAGAARRSVGVRLSRARTLLGYEPSREEAIGALEALGLSPRSEGERIEIQVPSWRVDLEREADVVEEIGRHLGYDRIPSRMLSGVSAASAATSAPRVEERVRDRLAGLGFHEAFNYAMIAPAEDDPFVPAGAPAPLVLTNPIAETLAVLRRAVLPGLLRAADQNLRRGATEVRLFEVGHVFEGSAPGALPEEPSHAAFAWCGSAEPPHWSGPARPADAYDAAAMIDEILAVAAGDRPFRRERADVAALHPGRSTLWRDGDGRRIAWSGPLHPALADRIGVTPGILVGEVDLHAAARAGAPRPSHIPVPRLPGTSRDLSIVLSPGAEAGAVVEALRRVPSPAPASFVWIDRYEGKPLAPGEVAMTLRVILQPLDRTLTDADAEAYRAELLGALESVRGARLRRIDT